MIIPNIERVLIKPVHDFNSNNSSNEPAVLVPGQMRAGDNLLVGTIVHPGDTKFKEGQTVYYSEYSASSLADFASVMRGEKTLGEIMNPDNLYVVVAADDILAYDE